GFHAGVPVKVSDVATVTTGYAPRQGVVTRGTNDDTVEGIVLMRRGQNPSVVLKALRERIAELHEHSLPNGIPPSVLKPHGGNTDVTGPVADESGHEIEHPVGTYPSPCALMPRAPPGALSGVTCPGVELHAVAAGPDVRIVDLAGKELLRFQALKIRIDPFY